MQFSQVYTYKSNWVLNEFFCAIYSLKIKMLEVQVRSSCCMYVSQKVILITLEISRFFPMHTRKKCVKLHTAHWLLGCRAVGSGGWGTMKPSDFDKSVNSISTRRADYYSPLDFQTFLRSLLPAPLFYSM